MDNDFDKFDIFLIFAIVIWNLWLTTLSLIWNFTIILDDKKSLLFGVDGQAKFFTLVSYLFFSGVIGGSFYSLRALYRNIGYSQTPVDSNYSKFNIKAWFFWYFYRPLQGGTLAIIILCLFDQGLLNISKSPSNLESIHFQVGLGFLVGFGAHEVTGKIDEIIKMIFSKGNSSNQRQKIETNKRGESLEQI